MARRCNDHQQAEPCFYCEKGVGPFKSSDEWIAAIQFRVSEVERLHNESIPAGVQVGEINLRDAVVVVRDYALGDLVMLSASLKALKQKDPGRPLVLVTRPELFDVMAGVDYLDAQLPKETHENGQYYRIFDLCGAAETEAGGKCDAKTYLSTPRPDIFAKALGVPGGAIYFPLVVNRRALAKLRSMLQGKKPPFIGLAPTCGSPVRVMPPEYVEPLVQKILEEYDGTVVLLGKTNSWNRSLNNFKAKRVVNLVDNLSVGELMAACSLMDVVISPDTGPMHVCGALGVKCLCVMGNNNPNNFSNFYPSVKTIQATELGCVPCNDYSIPCTPLPPGQYGAECMRAMTPDRIVGELKGFYNGTNIAYVHDTVLTYEGGAEITTKEMIKAGREMGYNIRLFDRNTRSEDFLTLPGYDLVILSNIWRLPTESMAVLMEVIRNVPYVKYEHDHDGLGDAPQGYPKEEYAEKIYRGSALNIFVSPAHANDYAQLSGGGICIPELIDTQRFRPVEGVTRERNTAIIAVPGKWGQPAIDYFIKANPRLRVDILKDRIPHSQMPELFSRYEFFAHHPQKRWPCDRVIFEAALCGCKIMAGDIVQAMSWKRDMTDPDLRGWLGEVPMKFWGEIQALIDGEVAQPVKKGRHLQGVK